MKVKPKICVLAATPLTVHFFFREHLKSMSQWADVTVVFNKNLNSDINVSDLPVRIKHINIMRKVSLWRDVCALTVLTRLFMQQNYDMIISLVPKAGFLSMLAAKVACVKIRVHIFQGEVWAAKSGLPRFILKTADRITASLATNLIAVSASERLFLEAHGVAAEGKVKILGSGSISGVDVNKFKVDKSLCRIERQKYNIPKDAVVALFLGRVARDKGVFELIETFSAVATSRKNLWLVIAGPDEENLLDQLYGSVDADLRSRVIFSGFLLAPEKLICASDFLCLLSYREGFGLCAIEAAACCVPTLGTNIYGLNDAVINNKTGILVPLHDTAAAVQAMHELTKNGTLRAELGAAGRKRTVAFFDQEKVIHAYDKEFFSLIRSVN